MTKLLIEALCLNTVELLKFPFLSSLILFESPNLNTLNLFMQEKMKFLYFC